jgi:alkylation response protein AidB-like acyl-CoA dehydrogenase
MSATAEREALRAELRRFLGRTAGHQDVRDRIAAEGPHDGGTWRVLARQFGLSGLGVAEEFGGAGGGWAELVLAFEELGATLLPSPLFATRALTITAFVESAAGDACAEFLPALVAGELQGALVTDAGGVRGRTVGSDLVLDGRADFVLDGATADLVVVPVQLEDGTDLVVVPPGASGLVREPRPVVDPTRPAARLVFEAVAGRRLTVDGNAETVLRRTTDLACVALAAEQLGGAQRCLDLTVAFVKERLAFGRPVGSFQAVKHALAEVLVEVDALRPAVEEAGRLADTDPEALAALVPVLAAHAAEAYCRAAAACVHLHGGMGFTWEHPAQLYYKRAMTSARLFGDPRSHRERTAAALLG